jgi:transcriptional regulator with XRE-family HTH domain
MKGHSDRLLAIPARRALRKLGEDLRHARRRRRIPMALLAEQAQISRTTLTKVEQGDPAVSLGIYAAVLFSLGLIERLAALADPGLDAVGLQLEQEQLPQRIVLKRVSPKPVEQVSG